MAGVSARVDLVEPAAAPLLARRFFAEEGETSPIVRALAHVPELVAPTLEFVGVALGATSLDLRTKELVILRVSALAGCAYCVAAHRSAAAACGIDVDALCAAELPPGAFAGDDARVLAVAEAVARGGAVPAATIAELRRRRGDHTAVEVVLVASATLMLNRFCTALGLEAARR
jgi:AhpD family alkylhydroperoxidase